MIGLFKNLARVGRGEPIPGAARVALPPRFAAARADDGPVIETWSDYPQPSPPPDVTPRNGVVANDPSAAPREPHRAQTEADEGGSRLHPAAKADTEAQPMHPNATPPRPSAEASPIPTPRDPPRRTRRREATVRDAPQPRNDTTTPLPAPPLGQAVLASQPQRRRETPPVIRVTIDRIDIRSPEPPRAARAVKSEPKQSVSLSDYLRRPGPEGRA
jgi:hypothetical protein